MDKITIDACAKLNLTLDVVGRRDDGYHLLESVMQSISLCDTVSVAVCGGGSIRVSTSNAAIADDESNIAYRAAKAFFDDARIGNPGIVIEAEKRIPVGAGMAGGSADGAAVITALDKLLGTGFDIDRLCRIGNRVGADVPFCITGGTQFARGTGEILSPLPPLPDCCIVIAKPATSVSTAEAYRAVDGYTGSFACPDKDTIRAHFESGSIRTIAGDVCNLFEAAIAMPEDIAIRDAMISHGALGACMTGSGSAVFGIFDDAARAQYCCGVLARSYDDVYLTRPTRYGCRAAQDR